MIRFLNVNRKVFDVNIRIFCVESDGEHFLFVHMTKRYGSKINRTFQISGPEPFPKPPVDVLWRRMVHSFFPEMVEIYGSYFSLKESLRLGEMVSKKEVDDRKKAFEKALVKAFPLSAFKGKNWIKLND